MTLFAKPTAPAAGAAKSARRYINQLQPGETIQDGVFLISNKDLRTTTNGGLYIHLVLMDRTGQILGRVWSATQQQYDTIPEGGFLRIRARVESYKGALQVIVDGMRPVEEGEVDVADFLPRTKYDTDQMWTQLIEVLRTVESPHLQALIQQFLQDESIAAKFKLAPAATTNHHAYVGGLLEHTLSLLTLATRILGRAAGDESHYPLLSRDLVLAGLFLHDIGKTAELTYGTKFGYSDAGQLVGHITQAVIWIDQKIADVEQTLGKPFPENLQNVLTHIVLAHHGSYEFGSPRLPACPEAIFVHYLDNIDAKLNMAQMAIENAPSGDSDWTPWVKPLETRIYRKDVMGTRNAEGGKQK